MMICILFLCILSSAFSFSTLMDKECIISRSLFQKDHYFEKNLSEDQVNLERNLLRKDHMLFFITANEKAVADTFDLLYENGATDTYNICVYYFKLGNHCENFHGYYYAPY